MGKQTILTFGPNPFEEEYIEKNNIKWSDWCHRQLYCDMKKQYWQNIDKIGLRVAIILFGMITISLTYIMLNLYLQTICIVAGTYMMTFGFLSLSMEVKHNGRQRVYDRSN